MHLKNTFIRWYFNEFSQDTLFQTMIETSENSPYHREHNVGIHTNMVVGEYLGFDHPHWGRDQLIGAFVCAFHDVGKPAACALNGIKYKPERGNYLSFGGHEQISARLWEDYAVRNWPRLQEKFLFTPFDIYAIGWLIEYHLPWGIKKRDKMNHIALTSMFAADPEVYTNVLLADTFGRISDDHVEKRLKVTAWVENFLQVIIPEQEASDTEPEEGQPVMIVPIAASGSGKTTYRSKLENFVNFSLDDLRTELYGDDYSNAFYLSTKDKQFSKKANSRFMDMVKSGENIYLDNVNTSKKRRRFYITEAKRKGYFVRAVLFPIALDVVQSRQLTRTDKTVPVEAVERQYKGIQMPQFGEVDDVQVLKANLPKSV